MARRVVRIGLVIGGAIVLFAALIGAEVAWTLSREYVEVPDFDVRVTIGEEFEGEPLRMVIVGDSTTRGLGVERVEQTLGAQVAMKVAESIGRPVELHGYGVSGAVSADVPDQLREVASRDVDVIVVEVGSNDVTHRTSLGDVDRHTERLLRAAKDRSEIVVLGSAGRLNSPNFPQPLRWIVMQRANAVRDRQRAVARRLDVPFMDVKRDVSPAYDAAGRSANSRDLFHPSAEGYEIWARPLAKLVVAQLSDSRRLNKPRARVDGPHDGPAPSHRQSRAPRGSVYPD